ncbi:MAG TPA: hypothetical protein VFI22_01830, partial [Thermomicrobiales bacterium]|nr:hypothetical protein [Thermomicrobiales bacterium]
MVQAPQAPVAPPAARRWSLTPTLEQVRQIAAGSEGARTVPIFRETMADLETPVSAFLKVRGDGPAFLLESIEGGERLARYSFIGANPVVLLRLADGAAHIATADDERIEPYDDPLTPLRRLVDRYRSAEVAGTTLPRFVGGAVGYLSYEAVRAFEPRVGEAPGSGLGLPDAAFMLVDSILVFDHLARTIKAVAHVHLDPGVSIDAAYRAAADRVDALIAQLRAPTPPLPGGREALPG